MIVTYQDRWFEINHSPNLQGDRGLPVLEMIFPDERTQFRQDGIQYACEEQYTYGSGLFTLVLYVDERSYISRNGVSQYVPAGKDYKIAWMDMSATDAWGIVERFYEAWIPGSRKPKVSFSWKARRPEFEECLELEGYKI